ncbi:MAG: hypothetical protein ACJ762_06565 [Solirubrobacteraceae bacterium]
MSPPSRLLSILLMVLAAATALAVSAPSAAVAATTSARSTDPFAELGGRSPSCDQDVGSAGRRNCSATGSIAHQYPVGNYGLDVHVDVGVTHLGDAFLGALQSVGGLVWMALVYALNGVLLLLEWGFSIDLLGTAMSGVRQTLSTLHTSVIGQSWFLAALSVTALWGMWRGLVQRQATQTIVGLLATVGLMVCALVILAQPDDTVGYASRLANDASLGLLAASTAQPLDHPARSLSEASQGVFDSLVRDPWCALQFGSVDYCDQRPEAPKDLLKVVEDAPSVADLWLASAPGEKNRDLLYELLKGDSFYAKGDMADPGRIRMQEAGGTFSRLAILGLIAIGLLGACALLAYLGIKLLLASVLALLLLLFAPAMLLAPAFGESGRATFIAWGKRLVGALAAKLVYALFLAVVLAGAAVLRRLEIGWFGTWLLQIAFWWGVLIKRHELIGFVSVKPRPDNARGMMSSFAQGYYALQMGRTAKAATQRVFGAPGRAGQALADRGRGVRAVKAQRSAEAAIAEFDSDGRRYLEGEQERAGAALAQRRQAERELRVVDRRLTGFDEHHAAARAAGRPAPLPNGDQAALVRKRRELLDRLAAPELRGAEQLVAHAARNQAQTGSAVTGRDLAAYRRRRAQDLAADLPVDHERHVRAAGLDPAALAAAEPTDRAAMLDQVARHLDRERELLAAIPDDDAPQPRELRIDPGTLRARVAGRRARLAATSSAPDRRSRT